MWFPIFRTRHNAQNPVRGLYICSGLNVVWFEGPKLFVPHSEFGKMKFLCGCVQPGHTRDRSGWVRSGSIWIDPRNAFTLRDVVVDQYVKFNYFGCGYRCISRCGLKIIASNGGHGEELYTRLLLLTRRRGPGVIFPLRTYTAHHSSWIQL